MTAWLWFWSCAGVPAAPTDLSPWQATRGGTYAVALGTRPPRLLVHDDRGRAVEHALVDVDQGARPVLVDPGECDDIGEARCFHPGGVYVLLGPVGDEPLAIRVDGPSGPDSVNLIP